MYIGICDRILQKYAQKRRHFIDLDPKQDVSTNGWGNYWMPERIVKVL